ncbi:DUF11 domain-containing protein [Rudanella paleaurantiibacter]|uniref:DUF11 domain-containing protein n=1 Tax=Rudanella paleaurantiibacter TaxID=2614655 RepID=A0A7J5U181_9BACT|nr:SdrD B-like domain-containing protein [Rudanella paleaurantiibacter]KAB7731291.1 DUF11 domain-containing protein [Rudanella paleaurantiibacter]
MGLRNFTFFLLVCLFFLSNINAVFGQSGRVFRDFNNNGIADPNDIGMADIQVQSYRADGTLSGTALTGTDGQYTLSPGAAPGEPVRVEFVLPPALSNYYPSAFTSVSGGNGTSLQFVTGPATNINYGVSLPGDYCESTPPLSIVCFIVGAGITVGDDNLIATMPANATGTTANVGHPGTPPSLVGAIWGTAWQPETGRLFSSAFMRRHTAFGIGGTGAVYVTESPREPSLSGSSLFISLHGLTVATSTGGSVTINTGNDPHMTEEYYQSVKRPGDPDNRFFADLVNPNGNPADAVGKIGLGDMDMSSDQRYLFVVNPVQNHLYRIAIDSDNNLTTPPTASDVIAYPLPDPGCVGGTARAFGLGVRGRYVFIGTVCDAGQSVRPEDLKATVFRLDTDTDQFSTVVSFPLNYYRGTISGGEYRIPKGNWQPWNADTDWTNATTDAGQVFSLGDFDRPQVSSPQPMLTDIAFDDDGSLVLAFTDRFGHMEIFHGPDPQGSRRPEGFYIEYDGRAGGDILRVCNVGSIDQPVYQMEQNGRCGVLGGGQFTDAIYVDVNGNPAPGEFEYYTGDNFNRDSHTETTMGSVAIIPGSGELIVSAFDPIQESQQGLVYTNGFKVLNNQTGQYIRAFSLLNDIPQNNGNNYFGKASGLGGIEVLCQAKSLEIGNLVWLDVDKDGIQDAGETPLAGVKLELLNNRSELVGTTTSDASGRYIFNQTNVIDTVGVDKPNRVGLQVFTTYTVRVSTTQFDNWGTGVLANLAPSAKEMGTTTDRIRDNNAGMNDNWVGFRYTTGESGSNNHTLDIGFEPGTPLLALSKVASQTQAAFGSLLSYTIAVQNTGTASATALTVQDLLDEGLLFVSATPSVGTFTPTTQGGNWLVPQVAPGEVVSLVIQATANKVGTLRNSAILGSQTVTVTTEIDCVAGSCIPIQLLRLKR